MKKLPGLIALMIGLLAVYFLFRGNTVVGIVGLIVSVFAGLYLLGRSEEKKETEKIELKVDEEGKYADLYDDGNHDFEKAKQIQEEILKNSSQNDHSMEVNAAIKLMLNKDFEGSIKAYERIMEKYPDCQGVCLREIGAAEFYLGHYEKALEKYIEAKDCGEDDDITEYNIWEACETIYKLNGTTECIEKYIGLYPRGRYIKKASKLVS